MNFEFATSGRIVFGAGRLAKSIVDLGALGRRALVVTGQAPERASRILDLLEGGGIAVTRLAVEAEPSVDDVREGLRIGRQERVDLVVGFGGGSALDAAKAIALLTPHPGDPLDYMEIVGAGRAVPGPGLPMVAIPTTAGTGSEVTRNSVLASPEHKVKTSLRSPWLLPRLAIVDPELTYGTPLEISARCGFDALTQLIEPYLSIRANPLTDGLCREGIRRVARALRPAARDDDPSARAEMSLSATLSGMALANAGLGIIHGLASVIGGLLPAPHGAICARLLAPGLEANTFALRRRSPDHPALDRLAELGEMLAGDRRPEAAVDWARTNVDDLAIPQLTAFGLEESLIPEIVKGTGRASSTRANPIALTEDEVAEILQGAL